MVVILLVLTHELIYVDAFLHILYMKLSARSATKLGRRLRSRLCLQITVTKVGLLYSDLLHFSYFL